MALRTIAVTGFAHPYWSRKFMSQWRHITGQTGGKTTVGSKHVFELESCTRFLLDGNSPVGSSFAGCFWLIQQLSGGKKLTFMTEHVSREFREHFLQWGYWDFTEHLLAKVTSMRVFQQPKLCEFLVFINDFWTNCIASMHKKKEN